MSVRSPRRIGRRVVTLCSVVVVTVSGCGISPQLWTAPPSSAPTAAPTPTPTPIATPSPTPSRCATPPPPPAGKPTTFEDYVALLPCFAPAPIAVPVVFPKGPAAEFLYEIPTTQPVAFITIDDGSVRNPWLAPLIKEAGVPVTYFVGTKWVKNHVDYWQQSLDTGLVDIEGHTVNHVNLRGRSYDFQRTELCDATDQLQGWFGKRPLFFRPPFGNRDENTLAAAWSCGLQVGFYWRETVSGGHVNYQRGSLPRAGDIILMHFSDEAPLDFLAALQAIKAAGLTPARLADYVVPLPAP